jgi:peptidoglycan L-alanyl-D-glutamate endopeptidase CwlK
MTRSLADLDSRFRPLVDKLLMDADDAGIPLTVICTLRTVAEQAAAVKSGRSKTMNSKHLPQPPEGKSLAIDVVPKALTKRPNWDPANPLWWRLGEIGKALGLRWGGQWNRHEAPPLGRVPDYFFDPGHFEYVSHEIEMEPRPIT